MQNTKDSPRTKVELILAASGLSDRDIFSKSDPICVVFQQAETNKYQSERRFVEIGRTERIKNCLNPKWNKKILMNYFFESKQPLRFELYDIDSGSQELSDHDFLGRAECELSEIVAAPSGRLTIPMRYSGRQCGSLIITAEELDEGQKESVYFVCHGRSLDKKDLFGKSDPFLEFYRIGEDGSRQMVHRTEVIKKTLNPEFAQFEITVRHLSGGDKDKEFLITCYDYDEDGSHDLIGSVRTSVNALTIKRQNNLPLVNEKKQLKKGSKYKDSGALHFLKVEVHKEFTFLDFITSGLQLEFAVAVDFTSSNGPVHSMNSLHYINSYAPNQYEMATQSVMEICEKYNRTKYFEATGFGAKIPPHFQVSHLFPLNLENFDRFTYGVEGVMTAYRIALQNTQLFGPTNFAPTINEFAKKAKQFPVDGSRYQILLIITDGIITDMEKTKSAIISASDLPISIIIIGVGSENFQKMDELDCDSGLLSQNGRSAKRDIVQFVPFRNFLKSEMLAKEVLAEVPEQVASYMKSRRIAPLPPGSQPVPLDMGQPLGGVPTMQPMTAPNPVTKPYDPSNAPTNVYPNLQNMPQSARYPSQDSSQYAPYPTHNMPQSARYPSQSVPQPSSYQGHNGPQSAPYHGQNAHQAPYSSQDIPQSTPYPNHPYSNMQPPSIERLNLGSSGPPYPR
ncbi:copine domain-containing protein [Ditylenchus destructor]|nr:copine domain-containing protein [Ditylenchus destructor]